MQLEGAQLWAIVIVWYVVWNVAVFRMMVHDKIQARRGGRRVRENTMLFCGLLGGALGGWIAMKARRHKTKHARFAIGFPLMVVIHVALVAWLLVSEGVLSKVQ